MRRRTDTNTITKPQNLYHGVFIAILVIVLMVFKNYAMYLTPNPAYVSAIILLYPLWIIWANKIYLHLKYTNTTLNNYGNYPHVKLPYVVILLASVIGLILLH